MSNAGTGPMNDDELGRLLSGAFDAEARGAVGDDRVPPPPRFAYDDHPTISDRSSRPLRGRLLLPLSAAAAVVILVGLVVALVGHGSGGSHAAKTAAPLAGPGPTHASPSVPAAGKPVHIKLLNADGSRVGVGMPVIAYFSKKITDGRALQKATSVMVNGTPATADWYFERSAAYKNYPYEAHLRTQHYWPAHSVIHVGIAAAGLSAGRGLHFDDSLTLDFRTGAQHIVTVDDRTHRLTFDDGGRTVSYPVSLGASATPTTRGTKVIMEKGASICMSGPGYDECGIKYTQRLTYDGEYLHSAPWNTYNIKHGVDSSNGCTNLLPGDAKKLYRVLRVGDVVNFPNADGPQMQLGGGYGDWNVPWSQWRTGGLVRTH
ncbi:L,D-transpeptidase [Jatrophihabitans endophyticus]|uniref:L,D-transpeptidase n=1 Tax=Jatrophihabitans endophyticus TaxID=1206085 RepID=UPI0019FCCD6B|nr:L,D-transpeptidase [Jatrophihabitans endophyticus]MBE7187255.1 L,D-transpeptidase [Jatrophihabitans endophyticus]